jgi:hypothetical protein
MSSRLDDLFARYADAYAAGQQPQARDYLAEAGPEADALAALIDAFLARAPTRPPDAESAELLDAFLAGEPPLVALRASRGVRVDDVVARLVAELGLRGDATAKVKRHYQRLEQGLLDAGRVSERVWDVLAQALPGARQLARPAPPPAAQPRASFRVAEPALLARTAAMGPADEPDEVDALFGLGRQAH